ncbi:t-SNARE [Neocallimastix californiae]|uniref:t-SNARE n=1 Tax=Neocallimastix californiae TaxID=1754190 RepID=A0A1Y2E8J4_9FUNG|nr:t-SNARE [Neocallimastix californiae]|eukprot:ORY67880.1 t-SNARE [Neocallimastix californiae]
MYRDRLTELRGGNQGYNQINDSQYDDNYNRTNNYGGAYSQRNGGSNNYGGAYSRNNGSGYTSPPRSGGGADISSQYSGRINNLNSDIKAIWNYIDKLDSLYNRNYNEVRRAENAENTKRIAELEERVTAEIQKITNQLKSIKAEGERISNPRDKRMVLSLVNNASNNLKKVFDSYNEKRKRYTEQGRNKMIRQYQIGNGSKAAYDEATQRRDQMEQINQSINELCDLFQDMNNMLVTQNETINIIEENVDNAEYNVEEASKELTKAIEIRKKSRKRLWIITGIVFVIIVVVIIMFLPQILTFISWIKKIFSFGKSDDAETANTNADTAAAAGNAQGAWDYNQQQQQLQQQQWANQQQQQQQQQWA